MELTNSQIAALQKAQEFLNDKDLDAFVLKGYAGSGKTAMLGEIISSAKKLGFTAKLCAPTGRAAQVMKNKIGEEATTIHKMIYSNITGDFKDEKSELIKWVFALKENAATEKVLFVVDEASMISDKDSNEESLIFGSGRLLSDLIEYARSGKKRWKILFAGDPAQLPPVNENFSPALSTKYLKGNYDLNCEECELTEVIRQKGNEGILKAASKLRDAINTETYNEFDIGGSTRRIEQQEAVVDLFDVDNSIVISFSNKTALEWNLKIRKRITGNEDISVGERLIVTANNYYYDLLNGSFVETAEILDECIEEEVRLKGEEEPFSFKFIAARIRYTDMFGNPAEKNALLLKNLLFNSEGKITPKELIALRVLAERKGGIKYPKKTPQKIKTSDPVEFKRLERKRRKEIAEYFATLKESPWYNALRVKFGYAVTCHKAQGGEWERAIVSFQDFNSYANEFFFRWTYTAITRAKKEVVAFRPPAYSPWALIDSSAGMNGSGKIEAFEFEDEEVEVPDNIKGAIPRNIYKRALPLIKKYGFSFYSVESFSWKERYTIGHNDNLFQIDFNYSGKGKIKVGILGDVPEKQKNLYMNIFNQIKATSTKEKEEEKISFGEKFLELFYLKIKEIMQNRGIRITEVKSMLYAEKYTFVSRGEFCVAIFYYNKRKMFSKKPPAVSRKSSEKFADYCLKIIEEGLE